MDKLPPALQPLAAYNQFLLYKLVPRAGGKTDKLPVNPHTLQMMPKGENWQNESTYWTTIEDAIAKLAACGPNYGIGYILTTHDPFFAIDIDGALVNGAWSDTAKTICHLLPGAAIEVSQSCAGLHIFGTGVVPEHGCKNTSLGLELYTERRFIALTGNQTTGIATTDCSTIMSSIVSTYFPPTEAIRDVTWTTKPLEEWTSPGDDKQLLTKALLSSSTAAKFGTVASFRDLWERKEDVLIEMFPPITTSHPWDQSNADAALAQHLAFWTGCNCDHIWALMWSSILVRDKWTWHKTYLQNTITRAVSLCTTVYTSGGNELVVSAFDVPKLKGSPDQITWALKIREEKLTNCGDNQEMIDSLSINHGPAISASFWINHRGSLASELAVLAQPAPTLAVVNEDKPILREGFQYLSADLQIKHFNGCVYVQDVHRIFTITGALLKSEQFNATYGGYVFQLDNENNGKTTRKAYEAFTESQAVRYPMAQSLSFRPDLAPGVLFKSQGDVCVNSYIPVDTLAVQGDITPFLTHLSKLIPDKNDQEILLAYMAACIQHKGHKFQWAPIIQGTQGNGKTLFTRCVAFAIGDKYTHMPFANELVEKYNEWLFNNIFVGVEDIVVSDHRQEIMEILKPMITNDRLAMRAMQQSQQTQRNCANFMLNMNPKTGFRIEANERRYAPFYTAQQEKEDVSRDGMGGNYFPVLYSWLRDNGYAAVNWFLSNYDIPVDLNPAVTDGGNCHHAPVTTSTDEAILQSRGGIEQEILEAIEQEQIGFAGGWVSSTWLDRLLTRPISHVRRKEILKSLGYIWHPSLLNGRANNIVGKDQARSRLFIQVGHRDSALTNPGDIAKAYEAAQPNLFSTPY